MNRPSAPFPRTSPSVGARTAACRTSALLGAAVLAFGTAPASAAQGEEPGDPQPTLDGFARSVTYDLGQQIALLRGPFEEIIAAIDGLDGLPGRTTMDARKRSLLELGPAAIPLMVPYVDPAHPRGTDEGTAPGRRGRAEVVAETLADAASIAATDPLLSIATYGSAEGRILALRALRTTPDVVRALDPLMDIVRSDVELAQPKSPPNANIVPGEGLTEEQIAEILKRIAERRAEGEGEPGAGRQRSESGSAADIKAEALRTIASLRTPEADAFVVEQLTGEDAFLRAAAVEALIGADPARSAPMVLELVSSDAGWASVNEITDYYDAHDALLQEIPHAEAFVRLSLDERLSDVHRAGLFDLMRETDTRIGQSDKRKLERHAKPETSTTLMNATLKLLARTGSRSAKRDLLSPFDDRIKRGRNLGAVLAERAALQHEIGDYNAAVRDWRDVIDRAGGNVNSNIAVGLARSLARAKKYRDAQETLQRSALSLQKLRDLAKERDFREMAQSRYANAFHLDD